MSSRWPLGLEQWGSSLDKLRQRAAQVGARQQSKAGRLPSGLGTLCGPGASSSFPLTALSAAQAISWHECKNSVYSSKSASLGLAAQQLRTVLGMWPDCSF